MRTISALLAATAIVTAALSGQAADRPSIPSYRGFSVGATYRDVAQRARALQVPAVLPFVCATARRTAQLMECRAVIRDTTDGAAFKLAAHFVDGRAGFVSFGDSGGVDLVARMQRELQRALGRPTRQERGSWEWGTPRRFTRLNWRARAEARWIYVTLTDLDVLDGIAAYVAPSREP